MDTASIFWLCAIILNILLTIVMIFIEKKQTQSVVAWVSIFALFPVVGFVFYIFFGNGIGFRTRRMLKKTNIADAINKQELDKAIESGNLSIDESTSNLLQKYKDIVQFNYSWANSILIDKNELKFYNNGMLKFSDLKKDILNAKKHIHLDYYIFANDLIGKEIIEICTKKAKEGVKVKILIDSLGSVKTKKRHFKEFLKAGGEFKEFFPPFIPFKLFNLKMNYRNHRKIAVIDGTIGYVGGMNLRLDHMGYDKKLKPWRDAHIRIEGAGVLALQLTFLSDWRFATKDYKQPINYLKPDYFPQIEGKGNCAIQTIASGPNNNKSEIKNALVKMINCAKKSIKIQTPYFVPDDVFLDCLKLARASGVDIEIMVPGIPDKEYVYCATLSYLRDLAKLGVKIYTFNGFLHSKTMIIDDEICTVGTCNCDMRSFKLNFEINTIIYNKEFTDIVLTAFENDKLSSVKLDCAKFAKMSLYKRFKMNLFRLFTPIM